MLRDNDQNSKVQLKAYLKPMFVRNSSRLRKRGFPGVENTAGIRSETSQLGVLLPAMASFQETIGMVSKWYRYCLVSVKPKNFVQLKLKFIFIIIIANVSHLQ